MATYQPPTETLPKFNEFVFNQANEPEYLDQLVVHKAGTETITGNKTFTSKIVGTGNIGISGTGTNKMTSSNTSATANLIEASSSTGGNKITTLNGGNNWLYADYGKNLLQVAGEVKIETNDGYNILTNKVNYINSNNIYYGAVELQISGVKKISAEIGTNRLTNEDNTITATSNNTITASNNNTINSTSGTNILQVGGNSKIITTSSEVKTYGTTSLVNTSATSGFQFATSGNTTFMDMLSTGGNLDFDCRLRSDAGSATAGQGTLSTECLQFLSPKYGVGYISGYTPLFSGCIMLNQINAVVGVGTTNSVPMSIYGFAKTNQPVQQGVLPFSVRITKAVFLSDGAAQNTPRIFVLEMYGGGTAQVNVAALCPSGAFYRSIVATDTDKTMWINNGFYFALYMDGASVAPKSWNIQLYYQQI
jgi:hypothetical protein